MRVALQKTWFESLALTAVRGEQRNVVLVEHGDVRAREDEVAGDGADGLGVVELR